MKPRFLLLIAGLLVGAGLLVATGTASPAPTKPTPVRPFSSPGGSPAVPTESPTPPPSPVVPTALPTASPSTTSGELTLRLDPDHGGIGSGVQIEGSVAPDLRTRNELRLEFRPGSAHRSLGDPAHTKHTGPTWPATWTLHLDARGQFSEVVKVPWVMQGSDGDLWEILPGDHTFALILDDDHEVVATFHVDAPPPPPTALPAPTVDFRDAWLVDAQTGWLAAERCQYQPAPTPDANANLGSPPPPACEGLIARTTDGGRTWSTQSLGSLIPQAVQFVDPQHGWLAATTRPYCEDAPCDTVIMRTVDGGARWESTYHTHPNSPTLMLDGHTVPAQTAELTTLAFTSDRDGWVFGRACADTREASCQPVLLVTHDGTGSPGQMPLPASLNGYRTFSLAHPTPLDGWIVASGAETAPARLVVTHDGGRTWQAPPAPPGLRLAYGAGVFFLDPRRGWLAAGSQPGAGNQGKEIDRTRDGGHTWSTAASTETFRPIGCPSAGCLSISGYVGTLDFVSSTDGWMLLGRAGLLHTTDGGSSWAPVSVGQADALHAARFANPRDGWVVESWALYATGDGGATWRQIAPPASG